MIKTKQTMEGFTRGFVFSAAGDSSVGIEPMVLTVSLNGQYRYDDDLKELQSQLSATIQDWIGENVASSTIEAEIANNMAEIALEEHIDNLHEESQRPDIDSLGNDDPVMMNALLDLHNQRKLATGDFTEGLDHGLLQQKDDGTTPG